MNEGTTSGHDFLIILIIVCIVALQVWVFYKAYLQINVFKSILPEAKSFKTIKIYVREDKIEGLDLEDVYANLDKYKKGGSKESSKEIDIETIDEYVEFEKKEKSTYNIRYFKMPNNVKVFDVPCNRQAEAMYKLYVSKEFPDYAEFELINGKDEMLKRMLHSPKVFIDSGSVYNQVIPLDVQKIEVVKKGTAMLINGFWKVEDPCKIVFHS